MHETRFASDASVFLGPTAAHGQVDRFRIGKGVAGICPVFVVVPQDPLQPNGPYLVLTLRFRASNILLCVLRVANGSVRLVEQRKVPRRRTIGPVGLDMVTKDLDAPDDDFGLWTAADRLFRDTSGGAYLGLDRNDVLVMPSNDGRIREYQLQRQGPKFLTLAATIAVPLHNDAKLIAAAPSADCRRVWYTTSDGTVGYYERKEYDADTGYLQRVRDGKGAIRSPRSRQQHSLHESIQNAFAVLDDGIVVVSSKRVHRFAHHGGTIDHLASPHRYKQSQTPKVGQIDGGSGTTPTVLDGTHVAIGDGDSPMHICVYELDGLTLTSRVAFDGYVRQNGDWQRVGAANRPARNEARECQPGESACENSFVYHDGLLLVGNTYGYTSPFQSPRCKGTGLAAYEFDRSKGTLQELWHRPHDVTTAPPKLSIPLGRVYVYVTDQPGATGKRAQKQSWFLRAFDAQTGDIVYDMPTLHSGRKRVKRRIDNAWATFSFAPDGSAFVGLMSGFLRVSDRPG